MGEFIVPSLKGVSIRFLMIPMLIEITLSGLKVYEKNISLG
jgi:hypothetical protein